MWLKFAMRVVSLLGLIFLWQGEVWAEFNFETTSNLYRKYDDSEKDKMPALLGISVVELVNKKEYTKAKLLLNQALVKTKDVSLRAIIHWWLLKIELQEGITKDFEKHLRETDRLPLLKNTDLAREIYETSPTTKREFLVKRLIEAGFFDVTPPSVCPYFELEKRQKRAHFMYLLGTKHRLPKKIETQVLSELYLTLPEAIGDDHLKKLKSFDQFFKNLGATDVIKRMEMLIIFGKNEEARRSFSDSASLSEKMSKLERCELAYVDAKVDRKMRQYKRAISKFETVIKDCPEEIVIKARYLSLLQKSQMGDYAAIAEFSQFVRDYPTHSFADDVLLFKAQILLEKDLIDEAQKVLSELIENYPDGDMVNRALFLKAFLFAKSGNVEKAKPSFDQIINKNAPDTLHYAQAKYWHARLSIFPDVNNLVKPKTAAEASAKKALLELVLAPKPTIYSSLADNVLRLVDEKIKIPEMVLKRRDENIESKMPQELEAIASLIVNGFRTEALFLLDDQAVNKNTIDIAAHLARFYVALNRPEAGHQKLVRCEEELRYALAKKIPTIYNEISYPRPFKKEVLLALSKVDVPAAVVYAVMRQESGFIKEARSFAQAKGLMQLMYNSALAESKAWPLKNFLESDLFSPEINILLGTSILKKYWQRFGTLMAGLAAYNAGPTAAKSWLTKSKDAPIDTFIESIPYKETREYLQSVGSAILRYSDLEGSAGFLSKLFLNEKNALNKRGKFFELRHSKTTRP